MQQNDKNTSLKPHGFNALILAAGTATRFGGARPKQYELLHGKPVLRHSLDTFLECTGLLNLKVVIHPDHEMFYREAVHGLNLPSPVIGGKSRKESCLNGLISYAHLSSEDPILVHDAARPFVTARDILNVVETLQAHSSVTLGVPICDTLRRAGIDNVLEAHIDRASAWAIQTPQGFRFGPLLAAHKTFANRDDFTDDCSVIEAAGVKTTIIPGNRHNIKITWPEDLTERETPMIQNRIPLIGQGFDVHAFAEEQADTIRLGGIDVPCMRRLAAHSDGDVALHALTDALLGAIGEGDIGQHFPPSDMLWKDKDSTHFLLVALELMRKASCVLYNVDLTIICESPKIGPVREKMRTRIANLLELDEIYVNIKATTTEKLGFTGRGEGIAAQAVVSLGKAIHA